MSFFVVTILTPAQLFCRCLQTALFNGPSMALAAAAAQHLPSISITQRRPLSSFRPHQGRQDGASFWKKKKATWTKKLTLSSPTTTTHFSALPFDLSPPPIDHDLLVSALSSLSPQPMKSKRTIYAIHFLQETVIVEGAKVSDDGVIETFNNDDEALDAANNGVVVGI